MTKVSIYEQEMFGKIHWRVMRDDGRLIFDRHQTDFESEADAVQAIEGEFRRKKLGAVEARIYHWDRQANGRRNVAKTVAINAT
jgi:hypothetical protein